MGSPCEAVKCNRYHPDEDAMSKPAAGSIFETDFFKVMDMSKMMGDFKMPNMGDFKMPNVSMEPLMSAQRKNIEAFTALNQAAFESFRSLAQRQTELVRQVMEDSAAMVNTMMTSPSPEDKVLRHAEASKAAVDKCLANARDISETFAKCNYQAMETVSNRLKESLDELKGMMKPNGRAAA